MVWTAEGGNPIPCVYNAVVFELAVTEHHHSKIRAALQLSPFTNGWVHVTFRWIIWTVPSLVGSHVRRSYWQHLLRKGTWVQKTHLSWSASTRPSVCLYVNACKTALEPRWPCCTLVQFNSWRMFSTVHIYKSSLIMWSVNSQRVQMFSLYHYTIISFGSSDKWRHLQWGGCSRHLGARPGFPPFYCVPPGSRWPQSLDSSGPRLGSATPSINKTQQCIYLQMPL